MNRLSLTVRLFAAVTAVTMTLALLGTVVSIAEPQRSVLIAKTQHVEPQRSVLIAKTQHVEPQPSSTPIALAMAPSANGTAHHDK
jgi:hypothetical protein